ncbi:MAG: hypothetical protein U0K60_07500 [Parafannyhessea umbonata]|nr:hypothetical protein [Parafannyhessea umbonata]
MAARVDALGGVVLMALLGQVSGLNGDFRHDAPLMWRHNYSVNYIAAATNTTPSKVREILDSDERQPKSFLKPRTYILAFDADTDGANDVFRFFKGRGIHGKGKCLGGIYDHDRVCDAAIKEVSHG